MHFKLGFTYHTWANLLMDSTEGLANGIYSNCFHKGKMMNVNQIKKLCKLNSNAVDSFHKALRKVSQQLGMNISLHDIPSFLNHVQYKKNIVDYVQNFPCYSICQSTGNVVLQVIYL